MAILLYIVIGIGCVMACGALWVINRQARDLARKQKELKRQKFVNKQSRIAEEIANRLKQSGRAVKPASPEKRPPLGSAAATNASSQKLISDTLGEPHKSRGLNKELPQPLPSLTPMVHPPLPQPTFTPVQDKQIGSDVNVNGLHLAVDADMSRENITATNEEPGPQLPPYPQPTFNLPLTPPPDPSAKPSLTEILEAANDMANKESDEQRDTPVKLNGKAKDLPGKMPPIKAGRGLPPLAQMPHLQKQATKAMNEAPSAASEESLTVGGLEGKDQASHIKWQPVTEKRMARQGAAKTPKAQEEPPLTQAPYSKGELAARPFKQRAQIPERTVSDNGHIINGAYTPDPEASLYEQISAYSKWLASQSETFTLTRESPNEEPVSIPLLFDEEALGRRNGHWFGLFEPVELAPYIKEVKLQKSTIYCPFDSAAVEALRRPGEEILRLSEEAESARYDQVIKESALKEFVTFLETLKDLTGE